MTHQKPPVIIEETVKTWAKAIERTGSPKQALDEHNKSAIL